MTKLAAKIQTRLQAERGATAVEYGVMVALIIAVVIGVVATIGQTSSTRSPRSTRAPESADITAWLPPAVGATPDRDDLCKWKLSTDR